MAKNVRDEARTDITTCWAGSTRIMGLRGLLSRHGTHPMYQAQLVRSMNSATWNEVKKDLHGVDVHVLERQVGDIDSAEAAAAGDYRAGWMANAGEVYGEVYVEKTVARPGGATLLAGRLARVSQIGRSLAGQHVGRAERDGLITTTQALGIGNPKAAALVPGAPPEDSVEHGIAGGLQAYANGARERFDKAQQALRELDTRLDLELHEIGPALFDPNETNPDEIQKQSDRVQAYIRTYRGSDPYKQARAEADAAARALGDEIGTVADDMLWHGNVDGDATDSDHQRTMLLDTYEALAASEEGALPAIEWAQRQLAANFQFTASERKRIETIDALAQATAGYYTNLELQEIMRRAAAAGECDRVPFLEQAVALIKAKILTPYKNVKGIVGLAQLGSKLTELELHWSILTTRNPAKALKLARDFITGSDKASPLIARIWTSFGEMIGTANGAALTGSADEAKAIAAARAIYDKLAKLRALRTADQLSEAEIMGEAKTLVREVHGQFKILTASRVLGVIGVAGGVLATVNDHDQLEQDPDNVALQIKMVADIGSVIGGAMCLIPPLAPLGAAISLIAAAVSVIAGFFVGDPAGNNRRREEKTLLETQGVFDRPELAGVLTTEHAAENLDAAQREGVPRTEILRLAGTWKFLFEKEHAMTIVANLLRCVARHPELGFWKLRMMPTLGELLSTVTNPHLLSDVIGFFQNSLDTTDELGNGGPYQAAYALGELAPTLYDYTADQH